MVFHTRTTDTFFTYDFLIFSMLASTVIDAKKKMRRYKLLESTMSACMVTEQIFLMRRTAVLFERCFYG
jgi:hypothetical protein